jgi:hypothetical protein
VKRVPRPLLGGKAFAAAQGTGVGIARRLMMKQRPMMIEAGAEGLTVAEPFYALAASSLHRPGQLPLHDLLSKICDKAHGLAVLGGRQGTLRGAPPRLPPADGDDRW